MGGRQSPEKEREYSRRYYWKNHERLKSNNTRNQLRKRLTSEFWLEQGGRCYLCDQPIELEKAVLDHDHRCCKAMNFCTLCARGAACRRCNISIGAALDDPDRMEQMAARLRARKEKISSRLKARGQQTSFEFEGGD